MSKRFLTRLLGTCTVLGLVAPVWAQEGAKPAEKPAAAKPAEAKPAEKKAEEPKAAAKPEAKAEKKGDEKGGAPGGDEMAAMMENAKPGENHKLLAGMVGDWTYTIKMNDFVTGKPTESTGAAKYVSLLDGRFIQGEHKGKFQMPGKDGKMTDMDFHGIGINGYDNAKKKFVNSWVDNFGTGIMSTEGTYDAATKTFTYMGEYEPMAGMKTKVREVIKIIDNDTHTFEMYESMGGAENKSFEITYKRKKSS